MKAYRAIGSYCEVFISLEKRPKAYKVKARTEPRRLLTVLESKTYLIYVPTRNIVIKTPFIKLYELKNLLTLEKVLKPIGIRPLNDIAVIEDFTGEGVLLDLPKIDDIGFSEPITPEAPGSLRPLELLALGSSELLSPGPFRLPELENRPLKPVFRPFEEPIKPVDFLDPDEM